MCLCLRLCLCILIICIVYLNHMYIILTHIRTSYESFVTHNTFIKSTKLLIDLSTPCVRHMLLCILWVCLIRTVSVSYPYVYHHDTHTHIKRIIRNSQHICKRKLLIDLSTPCVCHMLLCILWVYVIRTVSVSYPYVYHHDTHTHIIRIIRNSHHILKKKLLIDLSTPPCLSA